MNLLHSVSNLVTAADILRLAERYDIKLHAAYLLLQLDPAVQRALMCSSVTGSTYVSRCGDRRAGLVCNRESGHTGPHYSDL